MADTPAFNLSQLAGKVSGAVTGVTGKGEPVISRLASSSAECAPGALFFALPGSHADGHSFVGDAFCRGACAAVVQDPSTLGGKAGILVADTRRAFSALAAFFYGDPSQKLTVIGVTGTNGKTTTHWMVSHILDRLKKPSLRLGTLGANGGSIEIDTGLTTPDPLVLQELLARACEQGLKSCVMEVSSHALDQHRVDDVAFDAGIFTNLTRDHLDYHSDMNAYFEAKFRLFDLLQLAKSKRPVGIINADCSYGKEILKRLAQRNQRALSFGKDAEASFRIVNFSFDMRRSKLILAYAGTEHTLHSAFVGEHNAQNIAGAFAACVALGADAREVAESFAAMPHVPGRLQPVGDAQFGVFVDYAHTPDALAKALAALRPLTRGKLWVVFGCGGDRDRGKRPQMAKVAAALADNVVVTSDNPRTEDPRKIVDDILRDGVKPKIVEVDRRRALELTLQEAASGDVVLVAGKGHENYQIVGKVKSHFSDVEEVERILARSSLQQATGTSAGAA